MPAKNLHVGSTHQEAMFISELEARRSELQELKRCQLQYFVVSVGGTGGLIGLLQPAIKDGVYFLVPLAIILPCWLVFFDKATTITRIAGYCRWIERHLGYDGNETALQEFREHEDAERKKKRVAGRILRAVFLLRIRHRYWLINWFTFFSLSSLCLAMAFDHGGKIGLGSDSKTSVTTLALFFVCCSATNTLWVLGSLLWGQYSYRRVAAY